MRAPEKPFALLGSVRRSLRVLNAAIETACREAGLTMQQQAFLLVLAAHPTGRVPLADVRVELLMDQATASELLARLLRRRLVRRAAAADRRALEVSLTPAGRALLLESIEHTRREIKRSESRGELGALRDSIAAYLDYYVMGRGTAGPVRPRAAGARRAGRIRPPAASRPRAPRRGRARAPGPAAGRTRADA